MLFRRDAGHGLEPVGVVGGALFQRPCLHCVCHCVCHVYVQWFSGADSVLEGGVSLAAHALRHGAVAEHQLAEAFSQIVHNNSPLYNKNLLQKQQNYNILVYIHAG